MCGPQYCESRWGASTGKAKARKRAFKCLTQNRRPVHSTAWKRAKIRELILPAGAPEPNKWVMRASPVRESDAAARFQPRCLRTRASSCLPGWRNLQLYSRPRALPEMRGMVLTSYFAPCRAALSTLPVRVTIWPTCSANLTASLLTSQVLPSFAVSLYSLLPSLDKQPVTTRQTASDNPNVLVSWFLRLFRLCRRRTGPTHHAQR